MPGLQNVKEVEILRDLLSEVKCFIIADYRGLKVNEINSLRRKIEKNQSKMRVSKNRLVKLVLKEKNSDENIYSYLEGPSAFFSNRTDSVGPLKDLKEFSKENELFKIRCGIVEGKFFLKEDLLKLADLPGRQELLSMTARALNGPLTNFVNVLSGNIRNLVNVLNAVKTAKEK